MKMTHIILKTMKTSIMPVLNVIIGGRVSEIHHMPS